MKKTIRRRSWLRYLRLRWGRMAQSIDQAAVIDSVDQDGSLRASYLFMCVMSSGIAITGLLVNSPAVIIGAMLISPLMAPIVRLGLGVGTLDHERARNAFAVLAAGLAFALITAVIIVWLSPIREITSEIAARTRPSLFDLMIAVLSGLAGGYAMVRGRGGAIVGVAIATALMPPMAVVGFGLASMQWHVARGALLLFTTNLVAIALSVTAITTWYGFSRRQVRHALVWQTGLAFALVLPLALPLGQSLRAIAAEVRATQAIRAAVANLLGASNSRVLSLQVASGNGATGTRVELTIAARHYDRDDDRKLREAIQSAVGGTIELQLSPIIEADLEHPRLVETPLAMAPAKPAPPPPAPNPMAALVANFPIPLAAHDIDLATRRLSLLVAAREPGLSGCRQIEQNLQAMFPDWTVHVVPPVQGLPAIEFGRGSALLDRDAEASLDLIRWALTTWGVNSVRVIGFSSSEGSGNDKLARRRADAVVVWLVEQGFVAEPVVAHRQPSQHAAEVRSGRSAYRVAVVTPALPSTLQPPDAPSSMK